MNNSEKKAKELLTKIRELIDEEGESEKKLDVSEMISKYVLPSLGKNKDIQRDLYSNSSQHGDSFLRKIKNFIVKKVGNIARNVVERPFVRQQKFNNGVDMVLNHLIEENLKLREEIEQLKNDRSN